MTETETQCLKTLWGWNQPISLFHRMNTRLRKVKQLTQGQMDGQGEMKFKCYWKKGWHGNTAELSTGH